MYLLSIPLCLYLLCLAGLALAYSSGVILLLIAGTFLSLLFLLRWFTRKHTIAKLRKQKVLLTLLFPFSLLVILLSVSGIAVYLAKIIPAAFYIP